jgi:hypothetical protein
MRMRTQTRPDLRCHPVTAWRLLSTRHPVLRYAQILPIAVLLWGLDDVARFRAGAAGVGMQHAVVVNSISNTLGGAAVHLMNDWTLAHGAAALASAWYYILFQGAVTGVVGVVLIWRRAPAFRLHRNALIAVTLLGLVAFWLYPVAPPRMMPGYHDVISSAIPAFTSLVETNGAAQFASLPSLHVAWALWVAIALSGVLRHPLLRAAVWLYPVATVADVLATANHYLLDVVTAPGLLLVAYAVVLAPALGRHLARRRIGPRPRHAAATPGAVTTGVVTGGVVAGGVVTGGVVTAGPQPRSASTAAARSDDAGCSGHR